jgi:hypothetical protein
LIIRSVRFRSSLAVAGAVVFSVILLASYAFQWVVVIAAFKDPK